MYYKFPMPCEVDKLFRSLAQFLLRWLSWLVAGCSLWVFSADACLQHASPLFVCKQRRHVIHERRIAAQFFGDCVQSCRDGRLACLFQARKNGISFLVRPLRCKFARHPNNATTTQTTGFSPQQSQHNRLASTTTATHESSLRRNTYMHSTASS